MMDDILTSVAGPVSNFIVATLALLAAGRHLALIGSGHALVMGFGRRYRRRWADSVLAPVAMLLYVLMTINIVAGSLQPDSVPPLDGSHVLRHFLSDSVRMVYDRIGIFALLALVYLGGGLLNSLIRPFVNFYRWMLVRF
jgi:Zn-dependent protease